MEGTQKQAGALAKAIILGVVITTASMIVFSLWIAPAIAKRQEKNG